MQSNRLRYLREKESLTQTDIAHALHIGQSTYNRYERGIREPDHETLKKIADYFHVSLDFLLKPEFATKKPNHVKEKRGKSKVFLAFFTGIL